MLGFGASRLEGIGFNFSVGFGFSVHKIKRSMTSGSRRSRGTDGTNDTGVTQKSARRGIVNMKKVKKARTKGVVQTVNWNEMGQPIGRASMTLVHYIGSYTRRHVPITCDNWRRKDLLSVKQALWDEIKLS